ncbi:MAG: hypothetical protein K2Q26_05285 [Bdellovibrionales bacterium]|nr:hypothetical protein [Bdellovibrionales bacterium]
MAKSKPKAKKPAKAAKPAKPIKKAAKSATPVVAKKPVKQDVKSAKKVAAKATPKKAEKKPVSKAESKKSDSKGAAGKGDGKSVVKSLKSLVSQLLPTKKGAAAVDSKADSKKSDAKDTKGDAKSAKASKADAKAAKTKGKVEEEIKVEAKPVVQQELILTDAEGRRLCKVKDCDQPAVVEGYCRYHYLFFWKKIQNRKKILSEGKLEQYIEELTARYPLKFLELIRKDLNTEADFMGAIQELDIDENSNLDEFEDENFMEEVRGMSAGAAAGEGTDRVDDDF